jgi:transcriptional repressor NrdR
VLWVRKRDGRRQPFDRPKLLRGLARAIAKRPISLEDIERLSFEVEGELRALGSAEIESARIGDAALRLLGALDGVAYVRFASVYRQFDDVGEFQRELELLDADRTSVR